MSNADTNNKPFKLDYSNRVIEHLGIKLYQNKPTNVVSEYVSNSWDADATQVSIDIKASSDGSGPEIVITDNGRGMKRDEISDGFLVIGRNRRGEATTENTRSGRGVTGRKGIGKLAGFGIARIIDVISVPNPKLRDDVSEGGRRLYWLRFHLDKMQAVALGYEPEVLADGEDVSTLSDILDRNSAKRLFPEFVQACEDGGGGVCIYMHDSMLRKNTSPDQLLKSLGRRFTVTLLRSDFLVTVNSMRITPADAFPKFFDFKVGDLSEPLDAVIICNGEARTIKYWVRFVELTDEEWPIENAGVGIFAHGKIAQDRPFFFDVRGKEIFSRYMYGVIEADWLDELPEDVISTDRRSINWESDCTAELHKWGADQIATWIEAFRKWRVAQPKKFIIEKIRHQPNIGKLTAPEEEALAELLTDVLPSLGNNKSAKDTAIANVTAAWTHEPTRRLTQRLWTDVFAASDAEPSHFGPLIEQLRGSLVPEALSLAVTVAQRIAAITAMVRIVEQERNETYLQRLIEEFPWLLGTQWEKLTANQPIRTLVENRYKPQSILPPELTTTGGNLKPDFVFLSDSGTEATIVVFELKGPESGKALQPSEYYQLRDYLDIIQSVYTNVDVQGYLVGHENVGFKINDDRIKVMLWSDVLLQARKLHVSYLAALLKASRPDDNDERLRQISDFGGSETVELLSRFGAMHNLNLPGVVKKVLPDPLIHADEEDA